MVLHEMRRPGLCSPLSCRRLEGILRICLCRRSHFGVGPICAVPTTFQSHQANDHIALTPQSHSDFPFAPARHQLCSLAHCSGGGTREYASSCRTANVYRLSHISPCMRRAPSYAYDHGFATSLLVIICIQPGGQNVSHLTSPFLLAVSPSVTLSPALSVLVLLLDARLSVASWLNPPDQGHRGILDTQQVRSIFIACILTNSLRP